MFKLFGKPNHDTDAEEEEMHRATRSLNLRMQHMLEQENLKKIRFGTISSTPSYYR